RDSYFKGTILIPNNTVVSFEPYAMGRDESVYKQAGSFIPSRWFHDEGVERFEQYHFPVLQAGPRICIGKDLALYEAKFFITELVRKFAFTLPKGDIPQDYDLFKKDVGILNGKMMYSVGITLSFKDDLDLVVSE